jgi:hypothetical protein
VKKHKTLIVAGKSYYDFTTSITPIEDALQQTNLNLKEIDD